MERFESYTADGWAYKICKNNCDSLVGAVFYNNRWRPMQWSLDGLVDPFYLMPLRQHVTVATTEKFDLVKRKKMRLMTVPEIFDRFKDAKFRDKGDLAFDNNRVIGAYRLHILGKDTDDIVRLDSWPEDLFVEIE